VAGKTTASILVLLLLVLVPGCAIKKMMRTPSLPEDLEQLQDGLDVLPAFPVPPPETGSLWTSGGPGAALMRDTRAFRINDLVTIMVQESSVGSNESTTDLNRSSDVNYTAPFVFGLNKDEILDTQHDTQFSGDGKTERRSNLVGTLTVRVARVLPNGDLVIAGQKTVMVNREKQLMTLVGSIRPVDINSRNRVASSAIGDLTVRMWGNGEVDDTIRQGWFMRIMNRIWPF